MGFEQPNNSEKPKESTAPLEELKESMREGMAVEEKFGKLPQNEGEAEEMLRQLSWLEVPPNVKYDVKKGEEEKSEQVYHAGIDGKPRTFFAHRGTIAFVDGKGRKYVGQETEMARTLLESAGYTERDMFVPFSTGEVPVDENLKKRWEEVFGSQGDLEEGKGK